MIQRTANINKKARLLGEAGLLSVSLSQAVLLKDIQDEVMPFVVRLFAGIKVVPVGVVDRDAAILWIPVVHVIVTCRVPLKIMRIVHVGVVVKSLPVGRLSLTGRMGLVRCKAGRNQECCQKNQCGSESPSQHGDVSFKLQTLRERERFFFPLGRFTTFSSAQMSAAQQESSA
jgi:hypothetical protein